MNSSQREHPEQRAPRNYGFVIGLMTGTVVGAGLAIWFAPRVAAELREQLTESANGVRKRASDKVLQARARVGDAIGGITRKGQDVRDDVAEAVARGAREVERYATVAQTDRR